MRKVYWVVWNEEKEVWQVKINGTSLKNFETKDPAIDFAVTTAKNNQPSQVRIKKQDGKFENERTYDNDPYPPIG